MVFVYENVKFGLQSGNYFIYTDEDGNVHSEISMSLWLNRLFKKEGKDFNA